MSIHLKKNQMKNNSLIKRMQVLNLQLEELLICYNAPPQCVMNIKEELNELVDKVYTEVLLNNILYSKDDELF